MKVSQIAVGSCYENKAGTEGRRVINIGDERIYYRVFVPRPVYEARYPKSCTKQEFADWAHRPAGKKKSPL